MSKFYSVKAHLIEFILSTDEWKNEPGKENNSKRFEKYSVLLKDANSFTMEPADLELIIKVRSGLLEVVKSYFDNPTRDTEKNMVTLFHTIENHY